jgi:hypothetical protein
MRVFVQLPGVRDLWHVHTLHERESRLGGLWYSPEDSPVGEGQGRNPGVYTSEKSDRPIVSEEAVEQSSFNRSNMTTGLRRWWRKEA